MANSFVRYTGNGATTAYAIPFSYRSVDDLSATVNGVVVTAYTLDGAGTTLTFNTAPAASSAIEIRRTTSQATKLVDYVSGSVLTENDLDTDSDQAFFMAQEAIDKAGDVISLDGADFQWDVQNKRLKNVAAPVADTDAVNKAFISTNLPNITTVAGIAANVTTVAGISGNVTTVAANDADITTVATNIASVNTVATDIAKVIAVADDLAEAVSEVETVANDLNEATSEIEVVANNIANVNTVGTNIANVNTVAGISANVTTVAGISANVTSVAGISSAVSNVNSNSTNINAVNANSANINTVAGINANVTTVSGISADVTSVAGISGAVTAVNSNSTNINAVNANSTNINAVAGNATNINTVAGANANVTTVAGSIANVNEVANNIGTVNNFGDRYRVQAGEPSVNNDEGDLVYDTTANAVKVYNGTSFDTIQQGITDTAPTRHSIRPSLNLDFANSKILDPRITFTRASNATYYDGYTSVKAEENLYSYSQEFDNGYWSSQAITITADDIVAPDGTTTAEKITATSTLGAYINRGSIMQNGEEYTLSIYAKAGTADNIRISNITSGTTGGWFDLSTGTIGTQNGVSNSSTITDVGNGWYRITRTFGSVTANISTESLFGINDGDGLTTAPLNGYLYVWGAQLEKRSSATAYTPTTTSPITKYQPALQTAGNNVARFDHNPTTGESLGLLIEESRTNLFSNSEGGTGVGGFSNGNGTFDLELENQSIAPDGTNTGLQLKWFKGTTSGDYAGVSIGSGILSSAIRTFSFYGKSNTGSNQTVFFRTMGTYATSNITLTSEWQRFSLTNPSATTTVSMQIYSPFNVIYTDNVDISIWGYQAEEGSFPTSYIKTTGSQVTRSADDCEMLNIDQDDWLKQGVGTLYGEFSKPYTGQDNGSNRYPRVFGLTNNQFDTNEISIYFTHATTPSIPSYITKDGVNYHFNSLIQSPLANTYYKVSIAYERNNVDISGNGSNVATDTSAEIPFINRLRIFKRISYQGNGNYGTIKKLSYYPIKLTKNEVIDLTEE
jgi:hypothetical protein